MMFKVCTKCKEEKNLKLFKKAKKGSDGISSWCKSCHSTDTTDRVKLDRSKANINNAKYKSTAKGKKASKRYKSGDAGIATQLRHMQTGKPRKNNAKRRAAKLQRTAAWGDDWMIEQFYVVAQKLTDETGILFVVDHVIPLQGELVSGLHVETNLQIITGEENCKKYNRFEPIFGG